MDDYNISASNPYKRKKMNDHLKHKNLPSAIAYKMQLDRFEVFRAQDQEKGHFDCALEIGDKKLYCHKFILATSSETFNALLSDRWNKNGKNNVIKIDNSDYTYDCFFEFLTFVYSGDFNLTIKNVYVLTDMAEYYGVELLKEQCEEFFLSNTNVTFDNVEEMAEFAQKYSMKRFLIEISDFVESNFMTIINAQQFFNHRKALIKFLSKIERENVNEEPFFVAVCNWALHQTLKKKAESKKEDFDAGEGIKTELNGILSNVKFSRLNFSFVKEFILSKKAIFSPYRIYEIISKCNRSTEEEDECFKILYEIAEAEVKEKLKANVNDNFIFTYAIENELIQVLPNIKFYDMSFKFLMEFVLEKGIFLTPLDICMLYSKKCSIFGGMKIEDAFKAIYELAKKQVLMKHKLSNDAALNIQEAVKNELFIVLPQIQFCHMSNKFLTEFVIGNGIISEEQANHIFDVCISISHDNKYLYGIFKDDYGIMEAISSFGCYVNPDAENTVCFPTLKFKVPAAPYTVMKKKDVDWYLCFDENRCLAVKHQTLITQKDYLIVEMKTMCGEEFMFDANKVAHLTANWKNI